MNIFKNWRRREGFTLMELLVYSGVFTISAGLMIGVLNTVTNIQIREVANIEVSQQSQFVVSAIKTAMSEARLIDITSGTATSSLKLRMEDNVKDPTYIYLEDGVVYKKETNSGIPVALNDNSVIFNSLSFTRASNPPGRDVVKIDFTISYNSSDAALQYSRDFRSAIARVSAITFDSDLLPSSDNTYNVGASNPRWLNGFFSGSLNIGSLLNVGTSASDIGGAQNGSIYYNTTNDVFRGYINGAWADLGSSSGGSGDSVWSQSGSTVYYTSGGVGIGTSNVPETLTVAGTSSFLATSTFAGRVGINDTTPDYTLDVAGTGNFTTLSIGDTAVTATGAELNYVDGVTSAIQTQIDAKAGTASPTFSGSVVLPGTGIWNSSGNVGIGTASPSYKLHVVGDLYTSATSTFAGIVNFPGSGIWNSSGNLGVATTTPSEKLSVVGNGLFSGSLTAGSWEAELYTHIDTIVLESPTADDDAVVQLKFPSAVTISRISCSTDTGTATIQFDERSESTPNTGGTDVLSSALVCDSNTQAGTSFNNSSIAADAVLNLDVDAVASTPGVARIHIDYKFNDN